GDGDVVDPDAVGPRRLAAPAPPLPVGLRPGLLGRRVPAGHVHGLHAAGGRGVPSAVPRPHSGGVRLGGAGGLVRDLRGPTGPPRGPGGGAAGAGRPGPGASGRRQRTAPRLMMKWTQPGPIAFRGEATGIWFTGANRAPRRACQSLRPPY